MKVGHGSAPGKVIIAGEHSVVYGYPAIAVALGIRCNIITSDSEPGIFINSLDLNKNFRYSIRDLSQLGRGELIDKEFDSIALAVKETLKRINHDTNIEIQIRSDIPISAGLGSSAAVVVASIAAVLDLYNKELSKEDISNIAFESEKITHGKPSGIDNSIATYGGLLKFQNGKLIPKLLKNSIPLIVGNTKVPRDTKRLVGGVADLKNQYSSLIDPILKIMGNLAEEAEISLENRDLEKLGDILDINQGLLDSIGVGNEVLSNYIWTARKAGALGAKLTGAGGGGCMIALAKDNESLQEIVYKLKSDNLNIIATEISQVGVIIGEYKNE
ncbi:MAG: Mevalonate kinase [Candidatus Heimdallarchaeota archaeon LC_2]|nr:MAG: Mevalonate kinase [Candidatus Heimdallarchaeota archaeon LC_2]